MRINCLALLGVLMLGEVSYAEQVRDVRHDWGVRRRVVWGKQVQTERWLSPASADLKALYAKELEEYKASLKGKKYPLGFESMDIPGDGVISLSELSYRRAMLDIVRGDTKAKVTVDKKYVSNYHADLLKRAERLKHVLRDEKSLNELEILIRNLSRVNMSKERVLDPVKLRIAQGDPRTNILFVEASDTLAVFKANETILESLEQESGRQQFVSESSHVPQGKPQTQAQPSQTHKMRSGGGGGGW